MKYVKILGALAVALMAFAGTASATELTSEGKTYTGEITAVNEGGHVVLHGSFGVNVQCDSHVAGEVEEHGGELVEGEIAELSFSNCTEEYEVTVLEKGSLSINQNRVVRSNGATITVHTPLGINCEYTTENTVIGTLTDSGDAEGTATLDIEAEIPRTAHSVLCGKVGEWTGSYVVKIPDTLWVDPPWATTLTSEGETYTGEITAENEGGHVALHGSFGVNVQCASHVAGEVEEHGGLRVEGEIAELSFSNCTEEYEVTVLKKGGLSVDHYHVVRSNGATITVHTPLGINCEYTTENTVIGTLTDSSETEGTATLDIEAEIPRTGHSFLCGGVGKWTGSYLLASPDDLVVD